MREPMDENDPWWREVNWGTAILLLPFVLAEPFGWGLYFGAGAALLVIGNVLTAIVDGRKRRRTRTAQRASRSLITGR